MTIKKWEGHSQNKTKSGKHYTIDGHNCKIPLQCSMTKKKKNFMAPFYGWGSTASRLEPLRGGSLLFTTKFPEVPGNEGLDFCLNWGEDELGTKEVG